MTRLLALAVLVVAVSCTPEIPDATYVCTTTAECPPGLGCDPARGLCVRDVDLPDAGCTPLTCATVRAECGELDDGCGGTLSCGTCTAPETCGGDGSPNICGCTPRECRPLDCGVQDNGCGALMDCGGCDLPFVCGLTEPNQCGCTAADPCALDPKSCGEQPDGCGGTRTCNVCEPPETCGGGGEANSCGEGTCVPRTCAGEGANCGAISDGCGTTLDCGSCTGPQTCGGGPAGTAAPNRCGCTPRTCDTTTLVECGTGTEECGTTIDCGSCPAGNRCAANRCECAPSAAEPGNDAPSGAARLSVTAGANFFSAADNLHASSDEDFFTFVPLSDTLDERVTIELRVTGAVDLGIWIECGGGPASSIVCSPPSSDSTHLDGGCVSRASPGAVTSGVVIGADCTGPTFLFRVAGPAVCSPYDITILYTP